MGELFKQQRQMQTQTQGGFMRPLATPEQRNYLARLIQEDEEDVDWIWLVKLSKEDASQEINTRLGGRRR